MYFFNNLWKYYLKKDDASNPHRKMVSVPGNQFFSTKNYLFILNLEKNNFKLIFCNTTPVATLIQTFRNSPGPHHSAGLRNADVWAASLRPCGEHHPHISRAVSRPSPVIFCGQRGGRSYVMACAESRIISCAITSTHFLRHKPFNTLFIFSSQECGQNLICVEDVCLDSLPQNSPQSLKYVVGKESWFTLRLCYSLYWILSCYCLFGFEMLSFLEMNIYIPHR